MSAWGGYVFVINLLPLYALALMAAGRGSERLRVAYTVFYALGTLLAMRVRVVGAQHLRSGEHMLALATFAVVQVGRARLLPSCTRRRPLL